MIVGVMLLVGISTPGPAPDDPERAIGAAFRAEMEPLELRRALVFVGEDAVPALFEVWVTESVPPSWLERDEPILLSSSQLEVVRDALGALPRRALVAFLTDLAASNAKVSTRVSAIRLLEEIGGRPEADLVFGLAAPPGNRPLVRQLKEAVATCLRAWHEKRTLRTGDFGSLMTKAPPGLKPELARVLGSLEDPEAGRILAGFLGMEDGFDPYLLNELARRGPSGNALIDEDIAAEVRSLLRSGRPDLTAGIARIAGLYSDEDALPLLLEAAGEAPGSEVFAALARIAGLDFGRDLHAWLEWYDGEQEWWGTEGPSVLRAIETGAGTAYAAAVREALKHRLNRRRIAASLAVRLRDEDPACLSLTLEALGQVRAHFAVPAIEGCLDDSHPEVREAAEKALRRIQGMER